MNIREYHQLQAERTTLDDLLERLPPENVIERTGLEFRKKEVEEALASRPEPSRNPTRVCLTFRGKPIAGSHGIFADFGAEAVQAFTNMVATMGASQHAPLGSRGAIPNREEYRLLITGTASGSFGFELEEARYDLFPESSPVESAIVQTMTILEATVGADEVLANAVSEADPRALEALRGFLETMADQDAVCTVEFNDDVFRFVDVGQVRRSESRLSPENIHEEVREITGRIIGVLPFRRTFEFLEDETGELISGRIDRAIEDAAEIDQFLNRSLKIRVDSKQVGTARPRYVLLEYDI